MRSKILFSILWLSLLASVSDSRGQSNEQARLVVQTGHSGSVDSVAFSPDGKTLASGSSDETVKLWDVTSGTELRMLKRHSHKGIPISVSSVAFSPDGKLLASGSEDISEGTITLWDVTSGTEL